MSDFQQPQQPAPQPAPVAPAPAPASQPASQPEPAPNAQPALSQRFHVHHSYVWLGTIRVALTVLVVAFFSGMSSIIGALAEGEGPNVTEFYLIVGLVVLGCVLTIVIIALFQWWSYRHLYYQLGVEEFNLYSGIFNKRRVHVPYHRIQSVDQRASLLQRIFGVCTVSIDTAGGAANKAVMVPYLSKTQAEQLRRELFARKQRAVAVQEGITPADSMQVGAVQAAAPHLSGSSNVLDAPAEIWQDVRGVFGGDQVNTGRVTYEYGLSNKELIFTGLSNNTTLIVVILGVLGVVAQLAGDLAPVFSGSLEPMVGHVVAASAQLFGGNFIALGAAVFLAASLVMWIFSALGSCISYGGFRACRRDSRIEVEHGLLQHQFQGVDISRVQSVTVKQSFIRRLIGYCELSLGKIDAAAENSDGQQQSGLSQGVVIHPFVKLDRVPEILAGIIPEYADVPVENIRVAPVGLRRALVRRCILQGVGFWLALCLAITHIAVNLTATVASPEQVLFVQMFNTWSVVGYALCLVFFAFDVVGAIMWFKGSGFAYNDHFMQVSNGGLARETISFPRKKIQFGCTRSNPFQRHAHTATIQARTAAGVGGTTIRLIDARAEDAQEWLDWIKPRGNVIQ